MPTAVCMWDDRPVPAAQTPDPISIVLSAEQVEQVVRRAARARSPTIRLLVEDARAASPVGAPGDDEDGTSDADPRLSRSLLRGLALLRCLAGDERGERGIVELAAELGMSASTAHRYAQTLLELGLLERSPRTRKYRLAGTAPLRADGRG